MSGYLVLGLVAFGLLAGWHVAIRYAPDRSHGAHEAGHRTTADPDLPTALLVIRELAATVDRTQNGDPARTALLLAEIVRAKRPADELTMSRQMLDLLDEAAALVYGLAHPDRHLTVREVDAMAGMTIPTVGVCPDCLVDLSHHVPCGGPVRPAGTIARDEGSILDLFTEREPEIDSGHDVELVSDGVTGEARGTRCHRCGGTWPPGEPPSSSCPERTAELHDAGVIGSPDLCPFCGTASAGHDQTVRGAKMAKWRPSGLRGAVDTDTETTTVAGPNGPELWLLTPESSGD